MLRSILIVAALAGVFVVAQGPVVEHNAEIDKGALACEACQAIIFEASKKLIGANPQKPWREVAVHEALEAVCDIENFKFYQFSPPHMIKACLSLREEQEEVLEELLTKGGDERLLREEFCIYRTNKCTSLWTPEEERRSRGELL